MIRKISIGLTCLFIVAGCNKTMPEVGIANGRLTPCPAKPNCVNSQIEDAKHFIEPIRMAATPPEARARILKILNDLKQAKIIAAESNYIRAEFTSKIFRFVDDVEFYFPETKSPELIIHVRSASRVGYSDFGVNRKRIEHIRSKLKAVSQE